MALYGLNQLSSSLSSNTRQPIKFLQDCFVNQVRHKFTAQPNVESRLYIMLSGVQDWGVAYYVGAWDSANSEMVYTVPARKFTANQIVDFVFTFNTGMSAGNSDISGVPASNAFFAWNSTHYFYANSNGLNGYPTNSESYSDIFRMDITTDNPPNVPTITAYNGGFSTPTPCNTLTPTLTWNFTDPDAGDVQTAYEIQVVNGSNGADIKWSSGKVSSSNKSVAVPAGILQWGTFYAWQMRTYDASDVPSNWSNSVAWGYFKTNAIPTNPTNVTVSASNVKPLDKVNISWTASTDADGNALSYDLDFYNGSVWTNIATGTNATSYQGFVIPPIAGGTSGAKFRVRASDGVVTSSYIETATFTVQNVTSGIALPNAFVLDGVNDYVEILGAGNCSTACTLEATITTGWSPLTGSCLVAGVRNRMFFELYPAGNLVCWVLTANGTKGVTLSNNLKAEMKRNLSVSVSYDGANIRGYVDGVLVTTVAHTGALNATTYNFTVGKPYVDPSYLNQYFNGKVGFVRQYNTALSASTILANVKKGLVGNEVGLVICPAFNSSTGAMKDVSPNNYAINCYGSLSWGYTFIPLTDADLPSTNSYAKLNIDYLRTKVDEFRQANGLKPYVWGETIKANVTPIKATHVNEVQTAINEVFTTTNEIIINSTVNQTVVVAVQSKSKDFPVTKHGAIMQNLIKALKNI